MLSSQGNAPGLLHLGLTWKGRQKLWFNTQRPFTTSRFYTTLWLPSAVPGTKIKFHLPCSIAEDPLWPLLSWQNPSSTLLQTPCPCKGNTGLGAQLHSQHLLFQLGQSTESWQREQNLGVLGNGGEVRANNRLKKHNYSLPCNSYTTSLVPCKADVLASQKTCVWIYIYRFIYTCVYI